MSKQRAPSLAQIAYTLIRKRILCNELKSGQSLDEASLSGQLMLGRTPVREALQRLARERLLRVIPCKGVFVADLTVDTLGQVFEVRSSCEVQVARLAAVRADDADIEAMEKALTGIDDMIDQRRFDDLFNADERFHCALAESARNALLKDMLSTLYGLGIRYWNATIKQRRLEDIKYEMQLHRDILEAIKARDPERSAKAALAIIEGFPERILELIRRDPSQALFK